MSGSRRGYYLQLRASYEDAAMFAFEVSEAWRKHNLKGRATAAKEAEREFHHACDEVRSLRSRMEAVTC